MSTQNDIIDFVNGLESNYPVEDWRIRGVDIWPLIRILISAKISVYGDLNSPNQILKYQGRWHMASRVFSTLFKACFIPFRDIGKNAMIREADVVILVASSTRSFKVNDCWYNPYCDAVAHELENHELSSITLETAGDGIFRIPRYRPSRFLQINLSLFQMRAVLSQRLSSISGQISSLDGFCRMCDEISEFTRGRSTISAFEVGERVHYLIAAARFFERLLLKIRPKVVLYEGYYSLDRMALALASQRMMIESIEVQHGVQGPLHSAYANWTKIPSAGYQVMPNFFWVWGKDEMNNINNWTSNHSKVHEAFVGGNPTLSLKINSRDNRLFQQQLGLLMGNDDIIILYTLQAAYHVEEFLLDAISRSPPGWRWLFRCHPQYDDVRAYIKKIVVDRDLDGKVIIDGVSELPLKILLQRAVVHLTEFSSSVLESEALSVPSILVSARGRELFSDQISRGVAYYAGNSEKILEIIKELVRISSSVGRVESHENIDAGIIQLLDLIKKTKRTEVKSGKS